MVVKALLLGLSLLIGGCVPTLKAGDVYRFSSGSRRVCAARSCLAPLPVEFVIDPDPRAHYPRSELVVTELH